MIEIGSISGKFQFKFNICWIVFQSCYFLVKVLFKVPELLMRWRNNGSKVESIAKFCCNLHG